MIMCFKKKVMLPRIYFGIGLLFVFAACQEKTSSPAHWEYAQTLVLDTINPIGIAQTPEGLWLSDGDHNRLVLLDTNFAVIRTLDSLDRPMHICWFPNTVMIAYCALQNPIELSLTRAIAWMPRQG
jgi:hypothetical protein